MINITDLGEEVCCTGRFTSRLCVFILTCLCSPVGPSNQSRHHLEYRAIMQEMSPTAFGMSHTNTHTHPPVFLWGGGTMEPQSGRVQSEPSKCFTTRCEDTPAAHKHTLQPLCSSSFLLFTVKLQCESTGSRSVCVCERGYLRFAFCENTLLVSGLPTAL